MNERLHSHYVTLERIIGFTRVADTKAAPVLALQTALLTTLVSQAAKLSAILEGEGAGCFEQLTSLASLAVFLLTSATSFFFAGRVYVPMTPPAQGSLIYFEDIQRMGRGEFMARSEELSPSAIEEQLLDQIHRVSAITSQKMRFVRLSIMFSIPALASWAILLVLAHR